MKSIIASLALLLATNSYSYESKIETHYGITARIDSWSGKIENHSYGKNSSPIILEPFKRNIDDKFPLGDYKSNININIDSSNKFMPIIISLMLMSYSEYNGSFSFRVHLNLKNYELENNDEHTAVIFDNIKKDYCRISGELIHLKNGKSKIIMDNYEDKDSCNFKLVLGDDNNSLSLYVRDDIKNIAVTIVKGHILHK